MNDRIAPVSLLMLAALGLAACTVPVLTAGVPGSPGVPRITAFEIVPARIESGCPVTLRVDHEDSGADVTRAVMRWRARTGYQRYHDRIEVVPISAGQLEGRAVGHADIPIVPPHAGRWLYRLQLEDAQGRKSNVAESRLDVDIRPFWREARCDSLAPPSFQSVDPVQQVGRSDELEHC